MNTIDLKQQVKNVIAESWDEFALAHPHLAKAINREMLVESVRTSLDSDPEFQQIMLEAQTIGVLAGNGLDLIRTLARKILAIA